MVPVAIERRISGVEIGPLRDEGIVGDDKQYETVGIFTSVVDVVFEVDFYEP